MAPLTQPFSRLGPFKITGVGQVITVIPAGQYAQPGQLGQIVLYNESSFVLGISDTSTGARLDLQPLTANVYDPPAAGGALLATVISGIATTTLQRLSGQVALGGMQIEGAWPQTLSSIGSVTLPSVTTTTLQNATVNSSYSATLNGTGGVAPYTWAVTSGSLPAGLSLSSGGVISGTPTTAGSASFTVTLTDTEGNEASAGLSLVVNPLAVSSVPYVREVSGDAEYDITTSTLTISGVNLTAGDVGALFITTAQDSTSYPTISSVTDSGGNTWTQRGGEAVSNGTTATAVWWWESAVTNTLVNGTITVTFSAAPVGEFSGDTLVLSISSGSASTHSTSTGDSDATTSGSLTVGLADLVIGATVFDNSAGGITWSDVVCASAAASGATVLTRDFFNWQLAAAWCVVNNAGATALTGSLSASAYWANLTPLFPPS